MTGRPAAFRLGAMRERVTIQEFTLSLDTSGQPDRTWVDLYANQPANWIPISGGESVRGRTVEAGITAIFQIRLRDGITPQMRLVHRSTTYGIGYVKQVDGRDRYLEIQCRQAVA